MNTGVNSAISRGYGLKLLTQPDEEPIDLDTAKNHLRVDHTADDLLITGWIVAARQMTEQTANRRWVSQQLRMTMTDWPDGGGGSWVTNYIARTTGLLAAGIAGSVALPVEPVQSVDAVQYFDLTGTLKTLAEGPNYQTWLDHSPPVICPAPLTVWPVVQVGKASAVQIDFTAGYGAAVDVPQQAIAAMLLCLGYWYENRGDAVDPTARGGVARAMGIPAGALRLLDLLNTDGYR